MRRSTRSAFSALQLWDPKGGIVALDGLRGIAILLVLMRHAAYPVVAANPDGGGLDSAWFTFMVNGWVGVDLFFVLSGFLIGAHVLRMYERSPHHTFQWGRYLQNR
ncbi:MAG: acyltransferase family protein, partial [Alphaproteobacteria bacterium]